MKPLAENIHVSGQITTDDIESLANAGVKTIINNRPDSEAAGQPSSEQMQRASEKLNLTYIYLPMAGGISADLINGSITAYESSPKPIFTYCASGTRSTVLWCFAHVKDQGIDGVLNAAAAAGYNLEQIRLPLTNFAAQN